MTDKELCELLKRELGDVKGIIHNLFEFWDDDAQRTWYMNKLSDWMRKQKGLGL